jgi:hypothetical protein
MRYSGSYAPYFGNLYGPPQVVTAPPYYGPYYGGFGFSPGSEFNNGYAEPPLPFDVSNGAMSERPPSNNQPGEQSTATSEDEPLPMPAD